MHFCKKIILLAMTCLPAYAYCADTDASSNAISDDAAIVGRWQHVLPGVSAANSGNADVLEFAADHTFRLYLKCGRERSEFEKRGISYLSGDWKVNDSHQLYFIVRVMGKTMEQNVEFHVQGDELIFVSPENLHDKSVRFNGDVPLPCPK